MILSSIDRVVGVQGIAGTGKTTMLAGIADTAKRERLKVLGLAPSSIAARTLGQEAKIDAMTLQKFLAMNRDGAAADLGRTVIILDESSMASTRQMHDLLEIVERAGARKLVLVGDEKQLGAIDAGRPFAALQRDGMKTAVMDEIMRQRSPDQKAAVEASLAGKINDALIRMDGYLIETKRENFAAQAARSWLSLSPYERQRTGLIAQTHRTREAITEIVRSALKKEGRLTGPSMEVEGAKLKGMTTVEKARVENYQPGQIVRFNRPYKRLGVGKGDRLRVGEVDEERGVVTLQSDDGKTREWAPARLAGPTEGAVDIFDTRSLEMTAGDAVRFTQNDPRGRLINGDAGSVEKVDSKGLKIALSNGEKLRLSSDDPALGFIDHDYAHTVHAFQGQTRDHAVLVTDSNHPFLTTQQGFYVGLSRARDSVTIVTDDREALVRTLGQNTGEKIEALDILKSPEERARDREKTPEKDGDRSPEKDRASGRDFDDDLKRMKDLEKEMMEKVQREMEREMQREMERGHELSR